jgi:hypothetical protein
MRSSVSSAGSGVIGSIFSVGGEVAGLGRVGARPTLEQSGNACRAELAADPGGGRALPR